MAHGPTADSATGNAPIWNAKLAMGRLSATISRPVPAFDPIEFHERIIMLGGNGVAEMLEIFETETRRRLLRLANGTQDIGTVMREMHTLKGAAATVAAPRLTALGRLFEQQAQRGRMPDQADLEAIEEGLETFLAAVRARTSCLVES
jgi:HPt (histidine-containing phosphotransfer) domain-containing protein